MKHPSRALVICFMAVSDFMESNWYMSPQWVKTLSNNLGPNKVTFSANCVSIFFMAAIAKVFYKYYSEV